MRAAIYARVSSEEQVEGYSLDAQLRACRRYAEDHEWTVAVEFVEERRSGRTDDIGKRPQFKQMMEDADLTVTARFGSYDGDPVSTDSPRTILMAERR